jgi:uncharacterized protein (DUF2267 family)
MDSKKVKTTSRDADVALKITNAVLEILRDEIKTQITHEMQMYRAGIMVDDKWCCHNMRKFASKFWHIGEPARNENGFKMNYSIHGMPVNYCPFCGVKI